MMSYFIKSVLHYLRECPRETCDAFEMLYLLISSRVIFLVCSPPIMDFMFSKIVIIQLYLLMIISQFVLLTQHEVVPVKTSSWYGSCQEIWVSLGLCGKSKWTFYFRIFRIFHAVLQNSSVPGILDWTRAALESSNYNPGVKPAHLLLPACFWKDLLEHIHTHLFTYYARLLSNYKGGVE